MKSLAILKNETNVFYATCLSIFVVHLSQNLIQFFNCTKTLNCVAIGHNQKYALYTVRLHMFSPF